MCAENEKARRNSLRVVIVVVRVLLDPKDRRRLVTRPDLRLIRRRDPSNSTRLRFKNLLPSTCFVLIPSSKLAETAGERDNRTTFGSEYLVNEAQTNFNGFSPVPKTQTENDRL